jgi:MFS family permease
MAWLPWAVAALFYSYGFFQRVAPSVMVDDLMREFAVNATIVGQISGLYFYSYAALQVPIGMLLDRYGPRAVIVTAALLCAAGSALFGWAPSLTEAYLGRLLIGAGAGVSWIGALYVATRTLPVNRFASVGGLTMAAGMLGAIGGQAPLAALVQEFGWRATMLWSALGAALIAVLFYYVAGRDAPAPVAGRDAPASHAAPARPQLLAGLAAVTRDARTWILGAYTATVTGSFLTFGGLWGVPYLMQANGLSRPAAALVTSAMLVGWGAGGPMAGWLSDRLRRRRPVMLAGSVLMLAGWSLLLLLPALSTTALVILLGGIGMAGGVMVLAFALGRDVAPADAAGVMSGLINTMTIAAGALMQPIVGLLMDWQWDGTMAEGVRVYAATAYERAFICFPLLSLFGIGLLALVREAPRQAGAATRSIAGESARISG